MIEKLWQMLSLRRLPRNRSSQVRVFLVLFDGQEIVVNSISRLLPTCCIAQTDPHFDSVFEDSVLAQLGIDSMVKNRVISIQQFSDPKIAESCQAMFIPCPKERLSTASRLLTFMNFGVCEMEIYRKQGLIAEQISEHLNRTEKIYSRDEVAPEKSKVWSRAFQLNRIVAEN